MPAIQCTNVTIYYDNTLAVHNATFSINKGDYICIVGNNGSGKSTIVKGILGLIKPSQGKIIFGEGITHDKIGYLPQKATVKKDFPASVFEIVISGCLGRKRFLSFYTQNDRKLAKESIKKLEIESLTHKCFNELSGGQQQRVLIARALCAMNEVLILDEPVTGLDPTAINELYKTLKELNQKQGITIIMVSHDLEASLKNATKVLLMHTDVIFFGNQSEYLKSNISSKFAGGCCHDRDD